VGSLGEIMKKIAIVFCLALSLLQANPKEEFLKDQVCNLLPSLEGWCSKEKALAFIDLVLEVKPKLCVEIGVFGGASLFPVASTLKYLDQGIVVGIDPWERSECLKCFDPIKEQNDFKWWSRLDFDYVFDSYRSMIKRYGLDDFCVTVRSTSERAAICFDANIDILYIDGGSSEVVSVKDVLLYLPHVRAGGYIWINDAIWPKRQNAIDLLSERCDFVKEIDQGNCLLFKKR
jgi:hypothetical protein